MKEKYITWETLLKENKKINIVGGTNQLKKILKDLENDVDSEGFIIDSKTRKRVEANDLDEIRLKSLGVFTAGSKTFVKSHISNFSQYLAEKEEE